ncbi:MAG: sigma-70 family RNA polymerase sigma factor [Rhodothermales bacterium]|nr:sigma-70 family RNA polymerase sigma factor [Rhodothermales bacterium]
MTYPAHHEVTQLLHAAQAGDRNAFDRLFPLIYDELRTRARQQRRSWQGDYTLNTTALVHEAYLKLVDHDGAEWESRAHFLAIAARAMRHVLLDYAKRRRTKKRGGEHQKLSLEALQEARGFVVMTEERAEALLALDEALEQLAQVSERESRIVECRFFGGLTIRETAAVLGISPATVNRDWAAAQAWLYRHMQRSMAL